MTAAQPAPAAAGATVVIDSSVVVAYALAKHLGAPLLFKGNDFGHTDVTPA